MSFLNRVPVRIIRLAFILQISIMGTVLPPSGASPEQAKDLKQINDPSQRDQYLLKIAISQGTADKMIAEYQNAKNKEQKP